MGPGRLTGMNVAGSEAARANAGRFNGARSIDRDERAVVPDVGDVAVSASMGPGRLTGMNESQAFRTLGELSGFNGARSIDRDERLNGIDYADGFFELQWGPVD